MAKNIGALAITLLLTLTMFIGCAETHIYNGEGIKTYKVDIQKKYPNITKVEVKRVGIVIYISYKLKNTLNQEETDRILKTTKEYINKDYFINAISKEDKVDTKSFSTVEVKFIYPDPNDSSNIIDDIYGIEVK